MRKEKGDRGKVKGKLKVGKNPGRKRNLDLNNDSGREKTLGIFCIGLWVKINVGSCTHEEEG